MSLEVPIRVPGTFASVFWSCPVSTLGSREKAYVETRAAKWHRGILNYVHREQGKSGNVGIVGYEKWAFHRTPKPAEQVRPQAVRLFRNKTFLGCETNTAGIPWNASARIASAAPSKGAQRKYVAQIADCRGRKVPIGDGGHT